MSDRVKSNTSDADWLMLFKDPADVLSKESRKDALDSISLAVARIASASF